jgi:hypothetical protein
MQEEAEETEVSTVVPKLGVGPHVRSPEKIGTNLIKQVTKKKMFQYEHLDMACPPHRPTLKWSKTDLFHLSL